jgi:hypothetical protein
VARPADWAPLGCAADPVPGDPQVVEQEAARLAQAGAAAGRQSAGLRQVAAVAAGPELKGKFAAQAAGAATALSGEMTLVAARYAAVSRALGAWASALEEAQRMSLRALDMAVGPYRLLQAPAGQPAAAGQARAQGELDDARTLLAKALTLRDQEAAAAARAIRAACNDKLADANWKFGLTGPAAGMAAALLQQAAAGSPRALAQLLALQRAGTEPGLAQAVSSWWQALTPAQQHSLLQHDPQIVGALDGVPADKRDQANRAVFNADYAQVTAQIARLKGEVSGAHSGILGLPVIGSLINDIDGTAAKQAELTRLEGLLAGMNTVKAALGQPGKGQNGLPPVYLLGFDTSNLGHVIVSYGNPDTANNVVTYVPGLGTQLSKAGGDLTRALRTYTQANALDLTAATASIYWLGYDPPQVSPSPLQLPSSLAVGYTNDARNGAPALDSFTAGLRAAHDPSFTAHTVVLGHSYGSLTVGEATVRAQGKLADDIIFVGSPGVSVNNVDGLHMSGVRPAPVEPARLGKPRRRPLRHRPRDPGIRRAELPGRARAVAVGPLRLLGQTVSLAQKHRPDRGRPVQPGDPHYPYPCRPASPCRPAAGAAAAACGAGRRTPCSFSPADSDSRPGAMTGGGEAP